MIGRTNSSMSGARYSVSAWCKTIGLSYSNISSIPEIDMRQLMTKHASALYLYDWLVADATAVTEFVSNALAMKWIGLRDYICDKLMTPKTKNLLKPSLANTVLYGITFTNNNDGTYTANGTATQTANFGIWYPTSLPKGKYKFVCCPQGSSSTTYRALFAVQRSNQSYALFWDYGDGVDVEILSDDLTMSARIDIFGGATCNNVVFKPMLTTDLNATYDDFVQYGTVSEIGQKLLESPYWEHILKDHVPKMTSNTAPYGEMFANEEVLPAYQVLTTGTQYWQTNNASQAYIGYVFTNPVCVEKVRLALRDLEYGIKTFKLQGSSSKSGTWEDIGNVITVEQTSTEQYFSINNNKYYLAYRILPVTTTSTVAVVLNGLQFYGRALNVSVPTMTSNTEPYGEAFSSPAYSGHEAYGAFSRNGNYFQTQSGGAVGSYVGYKFPYPICIKKFYFKNENPSYAVSTFYYQVSNDGSNWTTIGGIRTNATDRNGKWFEADSDDSYLYHRIYTLSATGITLTIMDLQFFGVDFSEREAVALYEKGLELVPWGCDSSARLYADSKYSALDSFIKNALDMTSQQLSDTYYQGTAIITNSPIDMSPYHYIKAYVEYKGCPIQPMVIDVSNINESVYVSVNTFYYDNGNDLGNIRLSRSITNLNGSPSSVAGYHFNYPHDKASRVVVKEIWLE